MSYAHPVASSRRVTGVVITIALHIVLVYGLVNGLARKIVEAVRPPLETKIIEEVKAPPPPEKPPPPPPPKLATPPPPFIPPPEVRVQVPVQPPPTIVAVVPTPPPAPIPPPAAPAAPPPPAPPPVQAVVPMRTAPVVLAASCEKPPYPPAARRANETGTVLLSFLIDVNGRVVESKVERTSGYRRLDEAARQGLELCRFKPGTVDGKPTRSTARLEYVWKLD